VERSQTPGARRQVTGPTPATALLLAWRSGDETALDKLIPLVHAELRQIAGRMMARERLGHTLQPTALVNEVFLRLVDVRRVQWQNRAHFLAMAARLMRRVLVEAARSRDSQKRGGKIVRIDVEPAQIGATTPGPDLVALHDALDALATLDARKSQVVELRYFGGLSVQEAAEVLEVSPETIMRDWKFAKLWLLRELTKQSPRSR
jgi:RNA polymerase sigma factor (TIGR02999 family)